MIISSQEISMKSLLFATAGHLSPMSSLLAVISAVAVGFLVVVMFLDNNDNFALKRDWRK